MNAQIYDEASEWLIELQTEEANARIRQRFAAWLDTSPEHVRAYLEVISLWEDASDIDKSHLIDIDALMALAKTEHNLFPLEITSARNTEAKVASRGPWSKLLQPKQRRWRYPVIAASVVALGIGASATWYWNSYLRGVYSTAIAEQRTLALADGTTVELNADTRIRERFTDRERSVELLRGQALFKVAKNTARPFVVKCDMGTVRAIGTQFVVHRLVTSTTVTVLEGRVAVLPMVKGHDSASNSVQHARLESTESRSNQKEASAEETEILLGPGEQVSLPEDKSSAAPKHADLDAATAWTHQRLVLEFTNLNDAAEEFNRFNTRKLEVSPEGLEGFRVSGTFEALDPKSLERFVRFLQDQPNLTVVESGDRIRVTKNR